MSLLQKLIIFSICLLSSVQAEWDPRFSPQKDPSSAKILSNPEYVSLKKRVCNALSYYGCSAEKINLLMDLTSLTHPQVCVEVGAFAGSSVIPVCLILKTLHCGKMFAIDVWSNEESSKGFDHNDPYQHWWAQVDMESAHDNFQQLIKNQSLEGVCTEIRKSSEQAIDAIPEEIDFLHLDGNYSQADALQDVELYLPRVKPGGYILLSNLYVTVNKERSKMKSFCRLYESCEMIASIDGDYTVLFKKK